MGFSAGNSGPNISRRRFVTYTALATSGVLSPLGRIASAAAAAESDDTAKRFVSLPCDSKYGTYLTDAQLAEVAAERQHTRLQNLPPWDPPAIED